MIKIAKNELKKEKETAENINVTAARLHVLGDLLNSIGVVTASALIYAWPSLWYLDPICTCIFALIILWTTRITFMECIYILMQAKPSEIDTDDMTKSFKKIKGLEDLHDLHVWAMGREKYSFSCHIKCKMAD